MRILPQWLSSWNTGEQSCCAKKIANEELIKVLDKICRIVLAVFAAFIAWELFAISFAIGAVAAAGYVLYTQGGDQGFGVLKPVCGQGYMEFLSGKTFAPWTVHVVTTLFIGSHIRHDPIFFVPFCGVFIGWWAGSEVSMAVWNLGQRAIAWHQAPVAPCPCRG